VKINEAYFQEAKKRRGQLNLATVMAAEGKSPLINKLIIDPPKRNDIYPEELYDVVDEYEWVRIPRLDAHIVVLVKLRGQIHVLTNAGDPCLSHEAPGIRQAHWYLTSNFYVPIQKHIADGWIIAGFWTLYARRRIYNFPTPFQVFEIQDYHSNIQPYNTMSMWCEQLGMHVCPVDDELGYGDDSHALICRREVVLPDQVTERFIAGQCYEGKSLATEHMPWGLIQNELPAVGRDSKQSKITPILKHLGLPY